jgi:hypothetical protein
MSDVTHTYDVTGVVFDSIGTSPVVTATLTGTWTVTYGPTGAFLSVQEASFTLSVDVNGVPQAPTVYTDPVIYPADGNPTDRDTYQIKLLSASGGVGQSLYIDWTSETPTALTVGYQSSPPGPYRLFTSYSSTLYSGQSVGLENPGVVVCFCTGTQIRTPDGDRPVEALVVGQPVLTAAGEARTIRWIGHRSIDLARHPEPEMVRPIRIAAGALADGLPARDLLVSPDHAMLVDGALIPARLLVNHRSITEETAARIATYWHVELDSHDIILAEGAPTESYLDTGNRAVFANAPAPAMVPDLSVAQRLRMPQHGACLPLVTAPAAVFPIWQRLADRAGTEIVGDDAAAAASGHDGDIRLMAGARTLHPVVAEGGTLIFALPPGAAQLRLVSPAARPSQACPWLDDRRMLGVAIRALSADDAAVPLDGPGFGPGWWGIETAGPTAYRWSNGNALLTVPAGTKLLTLHVHALRAATPAPAQSRAA